MIVTSYRPEAKVTFFTEQGDLVARGTNDPLNRMDDDVLKIVTTRDMGADASTFSILLTRRKPWHKWVASNDLLVIELQRPPESLTRVFIGLVDDIRKQVSISESGEPTRSVSISGRGVIKAFINFDVGVVPEAEYASTSVGWLEQSGITLSGKSPSEIANAVWDKICIPHINYKWENGNRLFDYVRKKFSDRSDIYLLDTATIMNFQGSIYALLKDIGEDPFYEIFEEMDEGYAQLIMRPTPFNPTDWDKLELHKITDEDVVHDEIGRSDVETFSIYSVGAKTLFSPHDTYKTFGVLPYWYEPYSEKYGNRRLHVETSYTSVSESSDADTQVDTMKSMMKDLYNWNIKNDEMYNGTIMVKGKASYKVGTRLEYNSIEDNSLYEFYITSVSHTFINFGSFTTELGVIRGLNPSDRFTGEWDSYSEYSGMGIIPFDPEAARNAMELEGSESGTPDISDGDANKVVAGARYVMENGINGTMVKYSFGSDNPNAGKLDCSSFTKYIYSKYAGVDLGRTTGQQVLKGTKIDKSSLLPGDLIFFKGTYNSTHIYGVSHVGIYVGEGRMIHNSSSRSVTIDDIDSSYWVSHYLMCRRVLTQDQLNDSPYIDPRIDPGTDGGMSGFITYEATAYGANKINLGVPDWYVPSGKTATGTIPLEGRTIAVDPKVIPLHSKVYIKSSYPGISGEYIAEDTGGAIKGKRIDIYFNDLPPHDPYSARERMLAFGRRDIQVKVLRRGKG